MTQRGVALAVATLGGAGRLGPAPGTVGSAVVLPAALLGPLPCLALALALFVAGTWAVSALGGEAAEDAGWVVADEGAGQALALAAVPFAEVSALAHLAWVAAAFALFRAFDVTKPPPVSWADARPGPAWVMLDDALAGAMAAGVLLLARWALAAAAAAA